MEVFATEDGTIAQMKVATRTFVEEGAVLLTYKSAAGNDVHVKSNAEGIVTFDRTIKKNKNFDEGTLLATISPCQHEIVMKDMCADCGKDLREKDGRAGQRVENAAANVSMIHHVPELHVSNTLAQKIGSEDQQRLLNQKKLILLVDLDQTLIHTTNRPFNIDPDKQSEDIFKYTINNVEYTTKLRPYTREFLDSMSKLYELHIVTYGQRLYAHTIAEKIQCEKSYFDQRVLSRDELFSAQHKTSNLKALFPCGEQLIAIIDDRADVWQYSEALVQVKPYRFFKEVGDINAPVGGRVETAPVVDIEENAEDDNILQTIERVLTDTHRNFFNHYERTQDIRDVKVVISYLKKQVLRDLVIVLSGVVPIGVDMERCDAYRLCTQFGAKVEKHITDETTHVIAARWGTDKVHMANKKNIPVVSPLWLYACVEKWHRAEEKEFEVTKDTAPPRGRPVGGHLIPEIHCIDTIAKETINNMEHEVDEALSDEDDDDDGEEKEEEELEEEEKEENEGEGNSQRSAPKRRREEDYAAYFDQDTYGDNKQRRVEEADDEGDGGEQEDMEYGGGDDDETTMDVPLVDEDDEEYDDMAAMIERQISHDED